MKMAVSFPGLRPMVFPPRDLAALQSHHLDSISNSIYPHEIGMTGTLPVGTQLGNFIPLQKSSGRRSTLQSTKSPRQMWWANGPPLIRMEVHFHWMSSRLPHLLHKEPKGFASMPMRTIFPGWTLASTTTLPLIGDCHSLISNTKESAFCTSFPSRKR